MPSPLDAHQTALLRAILNRIVPADGVLPGAGDLDVGASVEQALGATPGLRRLLLDGLRAIDTTAAAPTQQSFLDLDPMTQTAVLESVERASPEFFSALVEHTYRGYYTLPGVYAAIGWAAQPPQPLGHELPPFDPELLVHQRQRAPFWRRAPGPADL